MRVQVGLTRLVAVGSRGATAAKPPEHRGAPSELRQHGEKRIFPTAIGSILHVGPRTRTAATQTRGRMQPVKVLRRQQTTRNGDRWEVAGPRERFGGRRIK